jgi:phospholipase/carboxylesterase
MHKTRGRRATADGRISRRDFAAVAGTVFGSIAAAACRLEGQSPGSDGRMTVRPKRNVTTSASGTQPLGLDRGRDAILHVPARPPGESVPLLVLLHGAGGAGERLLRRFTAVADAAGVAMLAPDSRSSTWDAIGGYFGRDVVFVNRALEKVFDTVSVDPARVAVGGFSDGASYALSLGLINGELFRYVLAFSPGFVVDGATQGNPRFFISHGTADAILPIDRCSRLIVPALRRRGYDVTFREFDGGHEMPPDIVKEGVGWITS